MEEFERNRIWKHIDDSNKQLVEQGKCIAKIKQYIEDKEKSTNLKITIFGVIFAGIAIGISVFK